MRGYQPINDDHAIESVVFTLQMDRTFEPDETNAIRSLHGKFSNELPALRNPASVRVRLDPDQTVRPDTVPGVEFAFLQPDGTPIWALRSVGNELVVECNLYSRWNKVWGASKSYLFGAVQALSKVSPTLRIVSVNLSVGDAFMGDIEVEDPSGCLKPSKYLAEMAFSSGNRWHSHTGWFDTVDGIELLHNLNLDAATVQDPFGNKASRLSILHSGTHRIDGGADILDADAICNRLGEAFETLHKENKRIVSELLVEDISAAIGLSGDKS